MTLLARKRECKEEEASARGHFEGGSQASTGPALSKGRTEPSEPWRGTGRRLPAICQDVP